MLHGWPSYWAPDLVRLAVLAVSEGRDNPTTRWPSADDLGGYYGGAFPADPIHEALDDDDGVIVANWTGAAEVEADVAVSLCRVGRRQIHVPERVEIRLLDEDPPEANPNLEFVFADLAEAITAWRDEGKKVLVHCVQAERRTPAGRGRLPREPSRRLGRRGIPARAASPAPCPGEPVVPPWSVSGPRGRGLPQQVDLVLSRLVSGGARRRHRTGPAQRRRLQDAAGVLRRT